MDIQELSEETLDLVLEKFIEMCPNTKAWYSFSSENRDELLAESGFELDVFVHCLGVLARRGIISCSASLYQASELTSNYLITRKETKRLEKLQSRNSLFRDILLILIGAVISGIIGMAFNFFS